MEKISQKTNFIKEIIVNSNNPLYVQNSLSIGVNNLNQPMLSVLTKDEKGHPFKTYIVIKKEELMKFLDGKQTYYKTLIKSELIFTHEPRYKLFSQFQFIHKNSPNIFLDFDKELIKLKVELEPLLK